MNEFSQIKENDNALKNNSTKNWSGHEVVQDLRFLNTSKEKNMVFSLNNKEFKIWIKGWEGYVMIFKI